MNEISMNERETGFGKFENVGHPFEMYKKHYAVLTRRNGSSESGRVLTIEKGYLVLFPYTSSRVNNQGMPEITIKDAGLPKLIPIEDITGISETSKKELEDYASFTTQSVQREETMREIQFRKDYNTPQSEETFIDGAGI